MSRDPFVTVAGPVPISAKPNVARHRRHPNDFHARRRRRHHHDAAGIVALIRYDDATRESDAQAKAAT